MTYALRSSESYICQSLAPSFTTDLGKVKPRHCTTWPAGVTRGRALRLWWSNNNGSNVEKCWETLTDVEKFCNKIFTVWMSCFRAGVIGDVAGLGLVKELLLVGLGNNRGRPHLMVSESRTRALQCTLALYTIVNILVHLLLYAHRWTITLVCTHHHIHTVVFWIIW